MPKRKYIPSLQLRMKNMTASPSYIRTMTVGSGISPDLLTSSKEERSRAFKAAAKGACRLNYRRWRVSLRPEGAGTWKSK